MHVFIWKGRDVLTLIQDAKDAPRRIMSMAEVLSHPGGQVDPEEGISADIPPRLEFVHDDGVYLMSNAAWGDDRKALIFYADGYAPGEALVGGDDFVESLDAEAAFLDGLRAEDQLVIRFDPDRDTFEISLHR